MTGLYNKQAIHQYAERIFAQQPDHPVHLAILDLDNFKNVNDTYGHLAGDEVLRKVGDINDPDGITYEYEPKGACSRNGYHFEEGKIKTTFVALDQQSSHLNTNPFK